ncbi:MAG TPA: hypothetical protein VGH96_09905, partial [Streptosporangiaceae bacterium]
PVAGTAAEVDDGPSGPRGNRPHRGQHMPGLVERLVLELVPVRMPADVGANRQSGNSAHPPGASPARCITRQVR